MNKSSDSLSSKNLLTLSFTWPAWIWAVILGIVVSLLGIWVIGDFTHPLSDGNDTDQFEYASYYFTKNISLWPFPHLDLINTQTFYPYGANQVFLDWGFERDYWYALCYWLFDGPGPYLQYYYIYTLLVAGMGTFLLLHTRFGIGKAFALGLIVSIFNFYGLFKFPVHMNVGLPPWTVVCMVATFRLVYDVSRKHPVSLLYVLFWVWLHVQVLSQELAYVAGYALTFTTLVIPVLVVVLYRWFAKLGNQRSWFRLAGFYLQDEFSRHKIGVIVLLLLIGLSLYLYLPLTLQIAFTAWRFDFGVVPELRSWSQPLRLFIPYLPGLHTFAFDYMPYFHDTFESFGQGSPGLYLVLLAGIGLWQNRGRVAVWLPIVSMLVLCLLYHPVELPTLKIFPWFSFNRHGGRASLVYPVLFGLLALLVKWPRQRAGQVAGLLLLGLMVMEWGNGFSQRLTGPVSVASDGLLRYCSVIRKQPGNAVLDWPFCATGANGVGISDGLCPYYDQQNAVFTFRRFYDKSVVGQYFGRLHPSQVQPFLRDGWPRLLAPGYQFTEADWQFFDTFLRKNNFAGINLYPNLLTPGQVAQFYQRYGLPIAQTRFPAAGKVVFLPVQKEINPDRRAFPRFAQPLRHKQ